MTDVAEIIRRLSKPLAPEPTGVEPRLPRLEGIRAVVFDVYGTLLISGSGDISLTSGVSRGDSATDALKAIGANVVDGDMLVTALREQVQHHHTQSVCDFPEVEIRDVWHETLASSDLRLDNDTVQRFATEYECRVNPVWPMPNLAPTLTAIRAAGLPMGIVSNAQFFTPIALEHFLDGPLVQKGFSEALCVWSYAHLQAKPGKFLYERAADDLATQGIAPGETLYVGNDMRNDVWPAAEVGFRTVLFAGDARSLRLREDDPRVAGVEPDAVVTDLSQILTILSLADG